jgi:hypothetical protein
MSEQDYKRYNINGQSIQCLNDVIIIHSQINKSNKI